MTCAVKMFNDLLFFNTLQCYEWCNLITETKVKPSIMTGQSAKCTFCTALWDYFVINGSSVHVCVWHCSINLSVYTYSIISVPYSRWSWQSALPPAAAERQQMSVSVPASPPRLPTPRSAPALCPATHFFTSSTLFFFYFSFSLFSLLSSVPLFPDLSLHFDACVLFSGSSDK